MLHPEHLQEKDIYTPIEKPDKNIKIISGSRFPIAAADLPYSSHVITKEEIRRNGYETLVDALKMVPGFRVSQPGSATEGETFQMRGLLGNTYAKILINDVPVKPAFVASMPIGAQLPIKEAERIEIIYGAGAALYGSDAAAGVINIITRESDRPVFMQADLSVGAGIYSGVNVMFGGRLGRDKHIIKYFAYGSNLVFEKRNIFYDKDYNYRPSTYTTDTAYVLFANYGAALADKPILTNTPHLSRKFGFNIKYNRFTLSAETMYRRDHSSLGHNPVAYSYRNPQTYTGEAILKFNLNIYKEKETKNRKTDFTYIRYNIDTRSSILPVQNALALMLEEAAKARSKTPGGGTALENFTKFYNNYLNGIRYMFGKSDEGRIEHVRNYRLFKYLTLTAGANLKFAIGRPFTPYLRNPITENNSNFLGFNNDFLIDSATFSLPTKTTLLLESNAFGQLFYNGKKFNIAAGFNRAGYNIGQIMNDSIVNDHSFHNVSPRLAGLWKITNDVNMRASWGTAFRAPNPYYQSVSFLIFSPDSPVLKRPAFPNAPERTTSWETGIRWKTKTGRVGAEAVWFLNKTYRLLRYNRNERLRDGESEYKGSIGYNDIRNTTFRYTGGNVSFYFKNSETADGMLSYSWLNFSETDPADFERIEVRPSSGGIWQFRQTFSPFKNNILVVNLMKYSKIAQSGGENPDRKFWTWDIVWRYSFTDRFDGYLKIINLFNKQYSGILPDGDPADLLHYNPQSGFFLRLGMNYDIE